MVGAVVLLAASTVKAAPTYFPTVALNLSGTVTVPVADTNDNQIITTNGNIVTGKLKTVSFNNKYLIKLLNASPTVQSYITNNVTHSAASNSIPAGSYFVWAMGLSDTNYFYDYYGDIWVTNKNGFTFDVEVPVSFYIYWDEDEVVGTASLNQYTGAGTEKDVTGVEVYFSDYNGNELEPEYGQGNFNWTYGAVSGGLQTKSISLTMSPAAYYAEVNDVEGITTAFSVSGGGSATCLAVLPGGWFGEPYWWYMWY
jgi:hypothetical protein